MVAYKVSSMHSFIYIQTIDYNSVLKDIAAITVFYGILFLQIWGMSLLTPCTQFACQIISKVNE